MTVTREAAGTGAEGDPLDVLIVGAGISGIGAAHYLQERLPGKSWAIVEARDALGGTWDLFRYPGVRSDSDLHTFGYEFRPWREDKSIATADRILAYLHDTATEDGIVERIRFGRRVIRVEWSSASALWTVHVEVAGTGETTTLTCRWIFCAAGYYRYDRGHSPAFPGSDSFRGRIVHPQLWPDDIDYSGKRVVVIGSGATAVTLLPAMAEDAAHVTMLQRTPGYLLPAPSEDAFAKLARRVLGDERAHPIIRRKSIALQRALWLFARRFPGPARRLIRWTNLRQLPSGYPVDEHFLPPYDVWDQRLCLVPDGDFFAAIRAGTASVVTGRIRTFTETGVQLESGRELAADIIVTATGLEILPFGGVEVRIDGETVALPTRVSFRGMMLDGIPNLAYAIGYTNASWTLKVGLLCEYFCRLLAHMDENGWAVCSAERPEGPMETRPLLDFGAGYVQRAVDTLPRQGTAAPWLTSMNYHADVKLLRKAPVVDRFLRFAPAPAAAREPLGTTEGGQR